MSFITSFEYIFFTYTKIITNFLISLTTLLEFAFFSDLDFKHNIYANILYSWLVIEIVLTWTTDRKVITAINEQNVSSCLFYLCLSICQTYRRFRLWTQIFYFIWFFSFREPMLILMEKIAIFQWWCLMFSVLHNTHLKNTKNKKKNKRNMKIIKLLRKYLVY